MLGKTGFKYVACVIGVVVVVGNSTLSYARGHDTWGRSERHEGHYRYHDRPRFGMHINLISNEYVPVYTGGSRYYYYDGLYYTPAGNRYVLMTPPIGAIVPAIPSDYRPVLINGTMYYTDSGIYYVYVGSGYQVVPAPMVPVRAEPVYIRQTTQIYNPPNQTKVAEGIGLGALLGALTGGIIGHQMKGSHEAGAALLGGVTGAAVGGIVGAQIPNQNVSTTVVAQSVPAVAAPAAPVVTPPLQSTESFTINIPNVQGGHVTVVIKRSGNGFVGPQGEYYEQFPSVAQLQAMYVK